MVLAPRVVSRVLFTAVLLLVELSGSLAPASAAQLPQSEHSVWLGQDGTPLPFRNDEEVIGFLRTAEMVSAKRTKQGVNNPWIVELEKDGVRARACFRDVSAVTKQARTKAGFKLNFRDDAVFEVAAYELGRLLGMRNIPPAVERSMLKRDGSLQLWVENSITEATRVKRGLSPSDLRKWSVQYELMVVFDNLIYNEDRNQGNVVFDKEWNRWLIDHTRSFSTSKTLVRPADVKRCDKGIWEKLALLDQDLLQRKLGDHLSKSQIEAILDRRDLLLDQLQERIDKYGQELVLIDIPSPPQ